MPSAVGTSHTLRAPVDPIRAVSVISTGSVEIHPEHALGTRKPLYWWLLTSHRWLPPRPINIYVIEHADRLLLFDTGQDRASVTDESYFPGGLPGLLYDRLARFHIGADETLDAQLATLGYAASDVDTAIVSHLHQDHIGGIAQLHNADLLVTAAEWAQLSGFSPEARGFLRAHIEVPGARWKHVSFDPTSDAALAPFAGSLDIMGDGSLTLLPTPGHTPGSVSLLVRRRTLPPLLLVGVGAIDDNADRNRAAERSSYEDCRYCTARKCWCSTSRSKRSTRSLPRWCAQSWTGSWTRAARS